MYARYSVVAYPQPYPILSPDAHLPKNVTTPHSDADCTTCDWSS